MLCNTDLTTFIASGFSGVHPLAEAGLKYSEIQNLHLVADVGPLRGAEQQFIYLPRIEKCITLN